MENMFEKISIKMISSIKSIVSSWACSLGLGLQVSMTCLHLSVPPHLSLGLRNPLYRTACIQVYHELPLTCPSAWKFSLFVHKLSIFFFKKKISADVTTLCPVYLYSFHHHIFLLACPFVALRLWTLPG